MSNDSGHVVAAQRRKKDFAIRAFGGKCQKCGYDKCQGALEFHHLDGETKKQKPGYIIARWTWERAKSELEKCVLLCANCHREAHYIGNDHDCLTLKRLLSPFVTVQCEQCHKDFDTKLHDAKYCSRTCCNVAQRIAAGEKRANNRPSKEVLQELISTGTSWIQVGKMFGVSNTAAKKWAWNYGLDIPIRRSSSVTMYGRECKHCHQEFRTPDKDGKFCSHECSALFTRKERPTKEELAGDLQKMSSYKASIKYCECSSVGQSSGLLNRGSWVRPPPLVPVGRRHLPGQ